MGLIGFLSYAGSLVLIGFQPWHWTGAPYWLSAIAMGMLGLLTTCSLFVHEWARDG